jgi:class 3 adenylate cyclase
LLSLERLSIQSKLMGMLLLVAMCSIVVVGWIAYSTGKDALTSTALNRLTSVRASKEVQIESFFATTRNQVSNLANDRMIAAAARDFTSGFAKFKKMQVKPEWDQNLAAFYRNEFLPGLATSTGQTPAFQFFWPATPEARYAQYFYISDNPNPAGERYELTDARDGSDYSSAHARYHKVLSKFIQDFRYDNLLLVDNETGDVVYTFDKSPIFGTNLLNGPYSETSAGVLFKTLRKSSNEGEVQVADFAPASYASGKPVALMGTAIFDGTTQVGVIFLQFPVDEINRVMTDNFGWVQDGLGRTGEVYLAGPEALMRSRSRLLHENRDLYFKQLRDAGYSQHDIDRVRLAGTATFAQQATARAVQSALSGKTGTALLTNYRGVKVLTSFAPLYLPGLRWVVISEMETSEAFAPLADLTRKIVLSSVATIILVTVASVFLGRRFVRPIFRLVDGAHRLEGGEKNVSIGIESRDEFEDLGEAFNRMSSALTAVRGELDQRTRECDELLGNQFPAEAAARMKQNLAPATQEYSGVSILYASLLGLVESTWSGGTEKSFRLLDDLVLAFDDAAERRGVERLSSNGMTYVACCGLSQGVSDHAGRVIGLAEDMLGIVERLQRDRQASPLMKMGIDSGTVAGKIVGRTRHNYFLCGRAITQAAALAAEAPANRALVSQHAAAGAHGRWHFGAPVQVSSPDGEVVAARPLELAKDGLAASRESPESQRIGLT